MLGTIQKNVLTTLHYFAISGKPLTLWECWQHYFLLAPLGRQKIILFDLKKVLSHLPSVCQKRGFYFLRGNERQISERQNLYNLARPKWKRAQRVATILAYLPYVRLVALCNTVAFHTAQAQSDIDLLIIVRRGRLWFTRFLVTVAVSVLRLRRHGQKIANRICLSFYLGDDYLNLLSLALPARSGQPAVLQDPYLVHWITRICPLYDDGIGRQFFLKNAWVKTIMPHALAYRGVPRCRIKIGAWGKLLKRMQEYFWGTPGGNLAEALLKKIQIKKMSRNTRSVARESNTKVVISDSVLKFHEKDARIFYRDTLDKILKFAKIV